MPADVQDIGIISLKHHKRSPNLLLASYVMSLSRATLRPCGTAPRYILLPR